ncbi:pentatricopeptide repeat protein [Lojkania enalia]|uniref:Pentatricopeptide repeat protein n=1 Tax=Lojkania enalia TaxID=147567 RepID=A0A9P4K601_9PLEO|nr:pentatricopeptide repeat protein [Didymosphaeria enalia]
MSLLRTLDRTTCTSAGSKTAPRSILSSLCPAPSSSSYTRSFCKSVVAIALRTPSRSTEQMDTFFIQALARAGSCQEHARHISTLRGDVSLNLKYYEPRLKAPLHNERKGFRTEAQRRGPFKKIRMFAENELRKLVDYYGIKIDTGPDPGLMEEVEDDGLLIWNVGDDHVPWPVRDEIHKTYVEKIVRLLNEETPSHEEIFSTYRLLPSPGIVYLDIQTIRTMLHCLSVVERPDQISMQRFLSILDDMKKGHIHIARSEWTSAIYFAGRFMGKVSTDELQSALHIWRDMENRARIRGGAVTLNVLFDTAVKSGKFNIAEAFLKEMQARGLKMHRHFRVSLLYYYGVKQNGDAIRQTYQDLVAAGDIVDTVVMNAVIAALIRAGEPTAAEHVFERMKRLHASKKNPKPLPRNWRDQRRLGLHLTWERRRLGDDLDRRKELQDDAPILPNARTYGLLIRHYSATAGNIDRVTELLREMEQYRLPIEGTIFIVILYGFCNFGGVRYSSWTRDKLERLWAEYLQSVQNGVQRTWLSPMAIIAALKAFKKCTNSERTLRAWEEVRQIWDPKPEELEQVLRVLRRLVPENTFFQINVDI